jgi:hypothetical protein
LNEHDRNVSRVERQPTREHGDPRVNRNELKDLRWVRSFIEYARYELQPGESQFGDQFPRQADADKAMGILDALLGRRSNGD